MFFSFLLIPDNNVFHLSDAASLLMRLELESKPAGVSLKDRWREVSSLYKGHIENSDTMLFYDFHSVIACLYGDQVRSSVWLPRLLRLTRLPS